MMIFVATLLVIAVLNSVLIERVYEALPITELRRRARSGHDKHAARIYKLMIYGPTLQLLLWLKASVSAVILIIWAAHVSWWLAAITGLLLCFAAMVARSGKDVPEWRVRYVSLVAPLGAKLLAWLQPLVGGLAHAIIHNPYPHTGLYEKEDLIDLLKQQARQPDSRFSDAQLKAARGALSFSDKSVGHVMTPRAKAKWVLANEAISPLVMDELHKTGQTRFPVVKQISKAVHPEVVGTLYIQDLLDHLEDKGHVRDLMHPGVSQINENQKLGEALVEFLKTGNYLLVVINNFDEVVGVITLEHVLGQIFGQAPAKPAAEQKEHSQPAGSKVE